MSGGTDIFNSHIVPGDGIILRREPSDHLLEEARQAQKPVIIDFYATWCTDCVRMEKTTFADPRVRAALKNYVLLQADVTDNNDASIAIKQKFGVFGPPALLLFSADGNEKTDLRFYGYRNAEEFLVLLGKV